VGKRKRRLLVKAAQVMRASLTQFMPQVEQLPPAHDEQLLPPPATTLPPEEAKKTDRARSVF
jgi:hypothetical protein